VEGRAVDRALEFLVSAQLRHGEFKAYGCADHDLRGKRHFDSSPFATSLVVLSLRFVNDLRAASMIDRAVAFLSREMIGEGLFRYYSSRNPKHIPFDLDDTVCASLALRDAHPLIAWGANLERIIANRDPGGRFYTWLDIPPASNSIDAVVNTNVICYLGQRFETRAACQYVVDLVRQHRERGSYRYYLSDLALYYGMSRAYAHGVESLGEARDAVVEKIERLRRSDGSFGDELATAWAICVLLCFKDGRDAALDEALAFLECRQEGNGSWRALAAYRGPAPYYGSEELTTAFCLEALARGRSEGVESKYPSTELAGRDSEPKDGRTSG
jgi:hypothetical protein